MRNLLDDLRASLALYVNWFGWREGKTGGAPATVPAPPVE